VAISSCVLEHFYSSRIRAQKVSSVLAQDWLARFYITYEFVVFFFSARVPKLVQSLLLVQHPLYNNFCEHDAVFIHIILEAARLVVVQRKFSNLVSRKDDNNSQRQQ